MLSKFFNVVLLILGIQFHSWAQTEHSALLEGSQAYQDGNFNTAIQHFQQAVDKNNTSIKGHYNLGNALYKNKQYDAAIPHFQEAIEQTNDNYQKGQAFYNLGNSFLAQAQAQKSPNKESKEQLEAAIEAYKSALRNNPKDFEAKNNLATAYKLLRKQHPPQQQQQQQQQQDQNQEQDNSSEKQEQEQQNPSDQKNSKNQEQGKQEQEQQNGQQEQPIDNTNPAQPKNATPKEMSKEQAKRLLQVIAEDDKDVQERLMQRQQRKPKKGDKTW